MPQFPDPLAAVVAELKRRTGDLRSVADGTGLAYDTVLRIKNGEGDPGHSKVMTLARFFWPEQYATDEHTSAA